MKTFLIKSAFKPLFAIVIFVLQSSIINAQTELEKINEAVKLYERGYERASYNILNPLKKSKYFTAEATCYLGRMYQYGMLEYPHSFERDNELRESLELFRKAVKKGNVDAIAEIGSTYQSARGVKKDLEKAVKLYKEATEKGSKLGQMLLGNAYENGIVVNQDYAEAIKLYKLAAAQNQQSAIFNLANMYEKGRGVQKNIPEAIRLYLINIKRGRDEKWAGNVYGWLQVYELGYSDVTGLLLTAEEKNDKGLMFCKTEHWKEAADMFRSAAEANKISVDAANWYGYILETGKSNQTNYAEAVKWYKFSADGCNVTAMYNLAILYNNGTGGIAKNLEQATQLAKKSAIGGNVYGQNLLGWYYEYGNDYIPKNYTEASKWLKAAADRGHTRAQYNLGMMYKNGWGVSSDYAKSQELFKSAAAEGDNDAAALYVKPVGSNSNTSRTYQ